jgi:hypothetical protein
MQGTLRWRRLELTGGAYLSGRKKNQKDVALCRIGDSNSAPRGGGQGTNQMGYDADLAKDWEHLVLKAARRDLEAVDSIRCTACCRRREAETNRRQRA